MKKHPFNIVRGAALGLIIFASACNLQLKKNPSPTAGAPLIPEAETAAPTVVPANADAQAEILSPQNGAEVPAGEALAVSARWSGGDAIEASLSVDGQVAADQPGPIPPGQAIELVWPAPTPGKHTLSVEFLDDEKGAHSAQIDITVTGSAAPALSASQTPKPGGASIAFVNLKDGDTLAAAMNSAGFAQTTATVQADGPAVKDVILEADGLQVARIHNDSYVNPFRADVVWTPYRGNGKYTLTAYARTADANENYFTPVAQTSLDVAVDGIPGGTDSLAQRFTRLYSERFGLSVPVPALARYIKPNPGALDPSRWVSVAYIGDHDYEIDLMDDGSVNTNRMAINHLETGLATICRPAGNLKMLVVFVDYGNTGVTRDQAYAALADAQSRLADWHQAFAASLGLSAPVLTVSTTPAFVSAPPTRGEFLTSAQVQSLTGLSTHDYDLTAQVDLDAAGTLGAIYHGLGFTRYGGCLPGGSQDVNLFMTVEAPSDLTSGLYGSLLVHELSHNFGWQHWWPTGKGGANDQLIWNYDSSAFAFLFFGWEDVDRDGTIEIFDPTPYGRSGS